MLKKVISAAVLGMTVAIFSSCSNELMEVKQAVPAVKTDTIPVHTKDAVEKTMAVQATVQNNGLSSIANVLGNGEIRISHFDEEGNESVQPYTINASANATVALEKDTVEVESFGVECIGYPESTTTDVTTDEKIGEETTMATWRFSDGQTATGLMAYAYDYVATTIAIPHVIVEDLRYNKATVEKFNENTAKVTLSYLVNYRSVGANYNPSGELEMLVNYIQVIPAKEEPVVEPKGPSYSWSLTFSLQEGKGSKPQKLTATMTVNSSEGTSWSYTWYAAQCGRYQNIETLYVKNDNVVLDKREVSNDASKADNGGFEKDGATWSYATSCLKSEDYRHFPTTAGGEVGPEQTVFFYTTDVVFTAPTGEKIEVHMHPDTQFGQDVFAAESSLKGTTQVSSGDTYTYLITLTQSANHYVSCTVVDVDGNESARSIECLNSGLFRTNSAQINLYQK